MMIIVTLGEMYESDSWLSFCGEYGFSEFCLHEGTRGDVQQEIETEHAIQYGLFNEFINKLV